MKTLIKILLGLALTVNGLAQTTNLIWNNAVTVPLDLGTNSAFYKTALMAASNYFNTVVRIPDVNSGIVSNYNAYTNSYYPSFYVTNGVMCLTIPNMADTNSYTEFLKTTTNKVVKVFNGMGELTGVFNISKDKTFKYTPYEGGWSYSDINTTIPPVYATWTNVNYTITNTVTEDINKIIDAAIKNGEVCKRVGHQWRANIGSLSVSTVSRVCTICNKIEEKTVSNW